MKHCFVHGDFICTSYCIFSFEMSLHIEISRFTCSENRSEGENQLSLEIGAIANGGAKPVRVCPPTRYTMARSASFQYLWGVLGGSGDWENMGYRGSRNNAYCYRYTGSGIESDHYVNSGNVDEQVALA